MLSAKEIYGGYMFQPTYEFLVLTNRFKVVFLQWLYVLLFLLHFRMIDDLRDENEVSVSSKFPPH